MQAFDHDVAPRLVALADFLDAILRAVERRGRRDLDRREGAVIEIGLHARQRRDQRRIADREADAPAGHRIGLAGRGEFDRDLFRARHLQHRGRRIVVEIDLGIGEIGEQPDLLMAAEIDDLGIEIEIDNLRRRIGREVDDQRQRLRHGCRHRLLQLAHEIDLGPDRDMTHRGAGDDEAEGMDRIGRIRREDDVAWRGDRLRQIGETLFRAEGDDHLALGIELDAETAGVIGRLGAAQAGDAARGRIAMGARILDRLDQLLDDMRRRRPVGIAHAKVDHIATRRSRLRLQRIHFGEDIGRQSLDAIEFFFHGDHQRGREAAIISPGVERGEKKPLFRLPKSAFGGSHSANRGCKPGPKPIKSWRNGTYWDKWQSVTWSADMSDFSRRRWR